MIYEEVSSPTGSDDNKCKESSDQPYLIADKCLDFTALIKTKIDDNLKQVLSMAMAEAFDQGYERGRRSIEREKVLTAQEIKKACDKGYEYGKKDGIQEGLDRATAAIKFLYNDANDNINTDIFGDDFTVIDESLDYILTRYRMDYIVDRIEEYTKQHKIKPVKAKDISKTYDNGYADGKKDGIQEGIDMCTSAINFLGNTHEKIIYDIFCINPNITEYPFDYVLDNYDMNTIVTKVNDYIKQQNEPRNAASRLIVDISNKFNIPVADVVKIIGIYEDNYKSTE